MGLGADHDGTLVGEGVDGVLAVVVSHTRMSDTAKGQAVVYFFFRKDILYMGQ